MNEYIESVSNSDISPKLSVCIDRMAYHGEEPLIQCGNDFTVDCEKNSTGTGATTKKAGFGVKKLVFLAFVGLAFAFSQWGSYATLSCGHGEVPRAKYISLNSDQPLCPVPVKVDIKEHETVQWILNDEKYHEGVVDRFSKSLQIDTVVYDETKNYTKMAEFHNYLEKYYPLTYKTAEVHKVNEYGLVFYFEGSNKDLKPVMLAAHMDTVPIGDPNDWTENPFSGRFDGEKFYGRGASDCKNLLVGLMEAVELLINNGEADFQRGIILAFGFDEEKSGWDGASHIGDFLVDKFGENSVEAIVDEGPVMFLDTLGDYYSMIINGEKGYIDLAVEVTTPGGHSSNPRDHTSIGMLSYFLNNYENEKFSPLLVEENPMMSFFECVGEHGRLPEDIADAAKSVRYDEDARSLIINYTNSVPAIAYSMRSSQAIDIIDGGDKANALPRLVKAVINHRLAYGNDLDTVLDKATKHAKETAEKYDIGLYVGDKEVVPETEGGKITISLFSKYLETAKTTSSDDDFWFQFTGMIKSFYEDEVFPEKFHSLSAADKKFIVTPGVMTGNTDTRHYWALTDHIFRVQPGSLNIFDANIHGPNEWVDLASHLQVISFYYNYISHFGGGEYKH